MNKKTIFIIDDQKLFANGTKQLLEQENDIIVNVINRGSEVLKAIEKYNPDAILLDLKLPDKTGFEVLEEIREEFPDLPVCILSTYDSNVLIKKAKSLQANAYFSKDATIEELRHFVFRENNDIFLISKDLQKRINSNRNNFDFFVEVMQLTKREMEIIRLIAKGAETKEIAEKLFISENTVKTHRKNIFKKLKVKNIPELLKIAYEYKIL